MSGAADRAGARGADPVSAERLAAFVETVRDRGRELYREMPWRGIDDPYGVLVSEIMLQQTQVARVVPRWESWMESFPTLDALAAAELADVLAHWQGLGYNRRAVALSRAARHAAEAWGGTLPADEAALRGLPGVGPATAAAVMDYAFRVPAPFIETNVRTVFLHHLFPDADGVPDRALAPLVAATWDREDPRGWGYALMDYGSWLKRSGPDAARRSRHHTRQSPFRGSRREKRAMLLRAVLGRPGGCAEDYAEACGIEAGLAAELLGALAAEGFLERVGDRYRVS